MSHHDMDADRELMIMQMRLDNMGIGQGNVEEEWKSIRNEGGMVRW